MMADRIGANYSIGQSILGRWRIRETAGGHGKSGMGIVYIADDLQDHCKVAIKTFQPELVADARIKRLLLSEANVWLEMSQHENIVSVERVEVIGSQPLIFMDYVAPDSQGRNCLTDHLANGAQPLELILAWAQQICAALTHMRACGIDVHRDLKPDNIMISSDGTVKVTDFGLARSFDGRSATLSSTSGQQFAGATGIVGTPGYIAPEVIIGHRADVRSDVYSFGLVLAQMITGQQRPPLTADGISDVLSFEQANLEIRRQTAPPTTRSQLHSVVSRCLQFEPESRYAHFPAVADSIRLACVPLDTHADRHSVAPVENDSIANQALRQVDSLRKLGRYDEALANIHQLRRDTDFSPALLDAEGLIRADIGDLDRAIELHEAACEVDAENPGFRINLGRAYRAASQFEAAREQIAMALDLGDRSAGTWSNLAICELDLKHYNEALIGFDHALALDPHFVIALLGRADALYRLGRIGAVLDPLTRALEMEPDHPGALKLLNILQAKLR